MRDLLENFVKKICPYKGHWCNGKHIPHKKRLQKTRENGYAIFSDEDLNKAKDKESCVYFVGNRCTHPQNPKNRKTDI